MFKKSQIISVYITGVSTEKLTEMIKIDYLETDDIFWEQEANFLTPKTYNLGKCCRSEELVKTPIYKKNDALIKSLIFTENISK